jgi:hypothetical protein
MTDLDKFYSDADRIVARAGAPGGTAQARLAGELSRHFLIWARDYGDIAADLAAYWTERYGASLATDAGRKAAVEWFGSLLSLLSGSFAASMDFPDEDWEEIRNVISAEAESLDIDLLTTIMSVIVERGKA